MHRYLFSIFAFSSIALAGDLVDGINSALKGNNIYTASIANRNIYQAQADIAKDVMKPSITLSTTASRQNYKTNSSSNNEDTYNGHNIQAQLKQKIFDMYAYENYKQGSIEARKAENDLLVSQQDLLANVTFLYLDVLKSHAIYQAAQSETRALKTQKNYDETKFKAGSITKANLFETSANYETAVASEIAVKNNFLDAIDRYTAATKLTKPKFKDLAASMKVSKQNRLNITAKIAILEQNNLTLKSATLKTESIKKEIEISKSQHFPTLDLVGSYTDNYNPNSVTNAYMNAENIRIKRIELDLNIPIYQGGAITEQTKQANYKYEQALANQAETRSELITQLRQVHHHIQNGSNQLKALESAVKASKLSLQAQKDGYKAGTRTNLELLSAIHKLSDSESEYAITKYNYLKDIILEKKLLGSLTVNDLEILEEKFTNKITIPVENL